MRSNVITSSNAKMSNTSNRLFDRAEGWRFLLWFVTAAVVTVVHVIDRDTFIKRAASSVFSDSVTPAVKTDL